MAKKVILYRAVDAEANGYITHTQYQALVKQYGLKTARSMRIPVEVEA